MSTIADLVRRLANAGASPEVIAISVEAVEAAQSKEDARRAKDRERKRNVRGMSAETARNVRGNGAEIPLSPSPDKEAPHTPKEITPIQDPPSHPSGVRPPEQAEKPKCAKPRSSLAEDAQPDEVQRRDAAEAGLSGDDFRREWRAFRDHHRAKGNVMADWQSAWRTWLGKRGTFQPARAGPAPQRRNPDLAAYESILEDRHRERDHKNGQPSDLARSALGIFDPPARVDQIEDRDEFEGRVIDLQSRCAYG